MSKPIKAAVAGLAVVIVTSAAAAGIFLAAAPPASGIVAPSLVQTCEASQRAAMTAAMHDRPGRAAPPECQRMTDAQWSKVNKDLDGLHNQLVAVKLEAATPTRAAPPPDCWTLGQVYVATHPDAAGAVLPDCWTLGQVYAAARKGS